MRQGDLLPAAGRFLEKLPASRACGETRLVQAARPATGAAGAFPFLNAVHGLPDAEQSAVITSQQNELENLREQNRRLLDKLEDLKCEIESRDQEKQVFEKQLQDAKAEEQTFALRDAESKLQLAQRTVLKLRKVLEDTRNECMTGVEQNKRMQTEIGTMRALLEQQQAESQKLVADLDLLEGQNNQLRANQQNLNDIRRKYAAKREKLESQIREERKEKRQWESVARFDRIIRNGQLHTTQEAFNEIEGTPENPATLE